MNKLESRTYAHLIELTVNVNSVFYATTFPETLTIAGQVYQPIPASIGDDSQTSDGELPQLTIDVSNYQGQAFKFARDNDLTLNSVTLKFVDTSLTNSGDWNILTMQIVGAVFTEEVVRFTLGWNFNYDAEGPRQLWNRRDYPSIPMNWRRFSAL